MIIGVAKEIKNNENRVGLTPAGTEALVKAGHQVLIEKSAGIGSGFTDDTYTAENRRGQKSALRPLGNDRQSKGASGRGI